MAVVETLEIDFRANLDGISEQLGALSARLLDMGSAMDACQDALLSGARALTQGLSSAFKACAGEAAVAGNMLSQGFAGAVSAGAKQASDAAQAVAGAADFLGGSARSASHSAGAALSEGFARGILSKRSEVLSAASSIAEAAAARIRSALKIHSPSKITFEMGGYFGEGFAGGIRSMLHAAELSAEALSAAASGALEAGKPSFGMQDAQGLAQTVRLALEEALGGTQIVIPLHVDSMKLGEASIRGINRVTRSAGRVMLEI